MEKFRRPGNESGESKGGMLQDFEHAGVRIVRMPTEPERHELNLEGFDAAPAKMDDLIKKRLRDFAALAEDFLAGSVITDSFADHGIRRMWRMEMSKKHGAEFVALTDKNVLRLNNLAGIYSWLHTISESIELSGVVSDRAQKIIDMSRQLPDISHYDAHSTDEKLAIAGEYERICQEYLNTLSR